MRTIGRISLAGALLLITAAGLQARDKAPDASSTPKQQQWRGILARCDYKAIAKAYADFMIDHGRDVYGKLHSPVFVTAMDRKTAQVFKHGHVPYPHVIAKPYAPGLRRDHKMRPQDRTYSGANPLEDLPLYGLLYRLSELTGDTRYAAEADKSIDWFLANAQSPATGLYSWGSHMYWDVHRDQPIYANTGRPNGGYGGHEYNYVWPYWERNPEALKRFAHGLWNHQIADQKTGRFSRHALYHKHGPGRELFEFPQMGSCIIDIWARQFGRGGDPEMKQAIQTLLKFYRSLRDPRTGAMAWCSAKGADRREVASLSMNLAMATTVQDAAAFVQKRDPALAEEMRTFVRFIDDEYLSNAYDKILDVAGKGILTWYALADRRCMAKGFTPPPDGVDASVGFPLKTSDGKPAASLYYLTPWFPGRSYAEFALLLRDRLQRCEDKHKPTYHRALLDVANIYMTIQPEVQFALYPDNISDVVELLRDAHKITKNVAYLHRADHMMRLGVRLFFDDTSPLPKITNFDDWYESSLKNESSVAILRQMIELSLDLEAIAKAQRAAPEMAAEGKWSAPNAQAAGNVTPDDFAASFETAGSAGRAGCWSRKGLTQAEPDVVLRYGTKGDRALYLSKAIGTSTANGLHAESWRINLSDTIARIPSATEADKLNGRMKGFTGKGHTAGQIAYGGYKDVPRQVALVIGNTGSKATRVRVEATLHDTYHDNGRQQCIKALAAGEQGLFIFGAPSLKWIRRLSITNETESGKLSLARFAFVMAPRNNLMPGFSESTRQKPPALVFLIAGQSNAGGVAAFSPESNVKSGMAKKHPTIPGSTAKEVGIPITKNGYPRSCIWKGKSFVHLTPGSRYYPNPYPWDPNRHGIELPMALLLEKKYPDADKFFVKHGPAGHNLHTQWAAGRGGDYRIFMKSYRGAMANLKKRYKKVRVIGLYWDQGESDRPEAMDYGKNLQALFAALREDTGLPDMQIFVRKHLFQHGDKSFAPILRAQTDVARDDANTHLLDLDLGSNEKNFKAWAWTDNNGHLSSKAFLELARRIITKAAVLEKSNDHSKASDDWGPFVGPWTRYDNNPIIRLEGKETYSIQNGPQTVIRWKGKWWMFLMTSQPMVTKLAVSDDGLKWRRPGHDYLLKPEMPWEGSYNLAKAAVVRGSEVWLYYFGKRNKREIIGLARSADLAHWKKEPKAIFTSDSSRIDGTRAFPDCVLKEGNKWYMYYDVGWDYHHAKNPDGYAIGVATSADGITWGDSSKSPVLTTSDRTADSWDDGMVSQCSVTKIGDWFFMLYSGGTNNHGRRHSGKSGMAFGLARARHPEGPWEKYPHNPVFKPTGSAEDFDGVYLQHPCPVKVGGQWRLYYNGWTLNPRANNPIKAEYAIGLAFAKQ